VEVQLGPRQGEYYPVLQGLNAGDKIAAAGGFLIDAETRLNPAAAATYFGASGGPQSDVRPGAPSSGAPGLPSAESEGKKGTVPISRSGSEGASQKRGLSPLSAEDLKNIEQLSEADRALALAQRICPVTGVALGSMGVPVKITLRGQTIFLCCKGCISKAKRSPDEMLKRLAESAPESRP